MKFDSGKFKWVEISTTVENFSMVDLIINCGGYEHTDERIPS
jgi:hypothetical protein